MYYNIRKNNGRNNSIRFYCSINCNCNKTKELKKAPFMMKGVFLEKI